MLRVAMSPERLAEIDRELDAFGKNDEELRAIVERARSWIRAGDLDGELAALAEGAHGAAARARAEAEASVQQETPEPTTSVMEALPSEPPSPPPPSEPPGSEDIAGLSVDELFADAEPSAPTGSSGLADLFAEAPSAPPPVESGLADLFDDEPLPFDRADADLFDAEPTAGADDLGSLEDVLEPGSEPPPMAPSAAPPAALELSPFGDEDEEITASFSVRDVDRIEAAAAEAAPKGEPSSEFELLVDDDVLELDEEELGDSPGDEPSTETRPGLISRILGRK